MRHLNYNHLLYFWTVAREGSIAKAARVLHLTPQTISGQLKLLDDSVGSPLFQRAGRGLALTETGHLVKQYADEIFSLGGELAQRVRSGESGNPDILNVGVVNSIPKLIAYRVLEPVLRMQSVVRIVCYEADLERLLGDVAVHRLDLVISDRPLPTGLNVKAYNHVLGESAVAFFAPRNGTARYKRQFPRSLDGAPFLMPFATSALRRGLDAWLDRLDIRPRIVAEFDDSALLKMFARAAVGVFPGPAVIVDEIEDMYRVRCIGVADTLKETYYAISPERKLKHPAVVTITESARESLFD